METDKTITRHVYNKSFMVRFSDRSEWKDSLQPDKKGGLGWYADGTKINNGIGAGVYDDVQGRSLASTLDNTPQYSKEKSCAVENLDRGYILSGSRAAIEALDNCQINSKLVWDCHQSLAKLEFN
jgi:hypothetical protein